MFVRPTSSTALRSRDGPLRALALMAGLILMVALAACGGGRDTAEGNGPAGPMAAPRAAAAPLAAVAGGAASTIDQFMDWAESAYADLFPGHASTARSAPYDYRYYPGTGNYLGAVGDQLYVAGNLVGNGAPIRIGDTADFTCLATPGRCDAVPGTSGTWSPPERLPVDLAPAYPILDGVHVLDGAGTAHLFSQLPHGPSWDTQSSIMQSRRKAGGSWEPLAALGNYVTTPTQWLEDNAIHTDAAGNLHGVVSLFDTAGYDTANYFDATALIYSRPLPLASWSAPTVVRKTPGERSFRLVAAVEPGGGVWLAWIERVFISGNPYDDGYAVFAAPYSAAGGLGTIVKVFDGATRSSSLKIASDGQGHPQLLLQREFPMRSELYWSRFDGTAWSPSTTVAQEVYKTGGDNMRQNAFVVGPNGDSIILWLALREISSSYAIHTMTVRHYSVGAGWAPEAPLVDGYDFDPQKPQMAMDPFGNATIVWSDFSTPARVWAARYEPARGWTRLDQVNTGLGPDRGGSWPRVAADWGGTFHIVWHQEDKAGDRYLLRVGHRAYSWKTGWGASEYLPNLGTNEERLVGFAVSRGGAASVLWSMHTPDLQPQVYSTVFRPQP